MEHIIKILNKPEYRFRITLNSFDSKMTINGQVKTNKNNRWETFADREIEFNNNDEIKLKEILLRVYLDLVERHKNYEKVLNIISEINEVEINLD